MKTLHFFTAEYPFGTAEAFIESEISYLATAFDRIIIYPANCRKDLFRKIPENCEVKCIPMRKPKKNSLGVILKNSPFIVAVLYNEFRHTKSKIFFRSKLRFWTSYLLQVIDSANFFSNHAEFKSDDVFYSFWMNEWAPVLSVLKAKRRINSFSFRVLGYDIYDERHEGNYLPFRYFNFKHCKNVFTVSEQAEIYLKRKGYFTEKIAVNYMGTNDFGMAGFKQEAPYTIYSCSRIVALKRIHLIVEILKHVKIRLRWIHQGDGQERDLLLNQVKDLPGNISFYHSGFKETHAEMINYIKTQNPNLFINVSETEGLPVTIMEAISLGIPVLATNVGGVSEIVNKYTGILIDKDIDPKAVAVQLEAVLKPPFNTQGFRKGVRKYWEDHFWADRNYPLFIQKLMGID